MTKEVTIQKFWNLKLSEAKWQRFKVQIDTLRVDVNWRVKGIK